MSEPLDIVCFYAELGRPYLPLIERMTKSAKRVMPYARTVVITPTPSAELCNLFDNWLDISKEITTTDQTVCYDRAR